MNPAQDPQRSSPVPASLAATELLQRVDVLLSDPDGPMFQVMADALGSWPGHSAVDSGQAYFHFRLALARAQGSVQERLQHKLSALVSDEQHPFRARDVATLLESVEHDPIASRGRLLEQVRSSDPYVFRVGLYAVRERFEAAVKKEDARAAASELRMYGPEMLDTLLALCRGSEVGFAVLEEAVDFFKEAMTVDRLGTVEMFAGYAAKIVGDTTLSDKERSTRFKVASIQAYALADGRLADDLAALGLQGRSTDGAALLLRGFAGAGVEALLDAVAADGDLSRLQPLSRVLPRIGVHVYPWVLEWCTRDPEHRLEITVGAFEEAVRLARADTGKRSPLSATQAAHLRQQLQGGLLDGLMMFAENTYPWSLTERVRSIRDALSD